jgi:hypothetical protein
MIHILCFLSKYLYLFKRYIFHVLSFYNLILLLGSLGLNPDISQNRKWVTLHRSAAQTSVADAGCIPDPNFFHPGSKFFPSRIRVKEFKYFNQKIVSKLSEL